MCAGRLQAGPQQNNFSMRVEVTIASLIGEAGEIQEAAKAKKKYSAATGNHDGNGE
jgi:hypothetical protein